MKTQMFAAVLAATMTFTATPTLARDHDGGDSAGRYDNDGNRGDNHDYGDRDHGDRNRGDRSYYGGGYDSPQRGYYAQGHVGYYSQDGYRGGRYYAPRRVVYDRYGYGRGPIRFRSDYYPPSYYARPVIVQRRYYGGPVGYDGYAYSGYGYDGYGYRGSYGGPAVVAQVGYGGGPGYYDGGYGGCRSNNAAGTILGALAGGLIGNSVAGYRDRGIATVVGAGVGAAAGTAISRTNRCD